ncbi:cell envelope integrity protein CreD [Flavobacteriaceae bacterium R38]|nr:cell envelope integrity protein CreD [Flavobacteriaceae bacterium R38]
MNRKTQKTTFFKTTTVKMLIVGVLILVLLIPLSYIKGLISERSFRQLNVVHEINEKWGKEVSLYGPILKIPYKTYDETIIYNEKTKTSHKEQKVVIEYAYFFPERLNNNIHVDSESLHRNNYETVVYTANMNIKGSFSMPDFSTKGIKDDAIMWDKARVIINTSNLKGIKNEVILNFGANDYSFEPVFKNTPINSKLLKLDTLESNHLDQNDLPIDKEINFTLQISYNGSERLSFIPIGKITDIAMTSDWHTPSFSGAYLPDDKSKEITPNGFKANWKVLHINRSFSQNAFKWLPNLQEYAFGVNFILPIDEYQKSERSAKYGYLVIALTFLIFFLIQTMSKIHIHPFQYLMIGLALTMFYTLLISISEHSSFLKAYFIATTSVVLLITAYAKTILKKIKFPLFIGVSLTGLYIFIFIIIQLENYALLVGSIGLFLILAAIMFASRKIDWNHD